MTNAMAKMSAFAVVALALFGVASLFFLGRAQETGGTEVRAAFKDAYPLLEGMNVRLYGAVAGRVGEIELGDDGNAHVTLVLFDGTEPPRADAVVSIRQEDITGDSYVSLEPGNDEEPLGSAEIPTSRSSVAPRFDDLLNSFNEPVRQGLELVLVQLGLALESRGQDLNTATIELRPALEVANDALGEVASQNVALGSLIESAERVNRQAADRSDQLAKLIDGLAATLQTTAAHAPALDRALETSPQTLRAAEGTLGRLTRLGEASLPLANTLEAASPDLARTAALLGPFAEDAAAIIRDIEPTLGLITRSFTASLPALEANPKRVLTAPFDLAAGIGGLLDSLIGDPTLIKSLFSADTYGGDRAGRQQRRRGPRLGRRRDGRPARLPGLLRPGAPRDPLRGDPELRGLRRPDPPGLPRDRPRGPARAGRRCGRRRLRRWRRRRRPIRRLGLAAGARGRTGRVRRRQRAR